MSGIAARDLRLQIVRPTLAAIGFWSEAAERLLLGTAAVESGMGRYLVQKGGGPALGIYQMEPATERDIWKNYLDRRPALAAKVGRFRLPGLGSQLAGNLYYATAMARVHYLRIPEPLPEDAEGMAHYWKRYWNTGRGKGTPAQFVLAFREYVR